MDIVSGLGVDCRMPETEMPQHLCEDTTRPAFAEETGNTDTHPNTDRRPFGSTTGLYILQIELFNLHKDNPTTIHFAPVAQLAERTAVNREVIGSNPIRSACTRLAQSVERWPFKPVVEGSSPSAGEESESVWYGCLSGYVV